MTEATKKAEATDRNSKARENRWFKQAGVVALAVIAAVVLMGQATQSKVVEAEQVKAHEVEARTKVKAVRRVDS